jgi:hypothetical protein
MSDCDCWSPHDHRPFCPASCNSPRHINALISRSSLGAALRDIEERGLEAHLKDLERDLDKPWRRK